MMMEWLTMISPVDGQILLVGEGDFSFAVAMTSKLEEEMCSKVIASSIETDESIKKHVKAGDNIIQLRNKGVEVRLSTDATNLHTDEFLKNIKFSRIIFNFPHTGGKSDLKRNRKLLDDFFSSACNILDSRGHIMVTLCKGQGGTPADQPMREWHDSWQIVSMAANSGFILVKTMPFKEEDYAVYNSTGFRSQDKGFHTDNAVTHVFERAECVPVPDSVDNIPISVDGKTLDCPPYLYKKLQHIRTLEKEQQHIIHSVYTHMSKKGQIFYTGSEACKDNGFQRCLLVESSNTDDVIAETDKIRSTTSIDGVYKLGVRESFNEDAEKFDDVCMLGSTQAVGQDCKKYQFVSSLVDYVDKFPEIVTSDGFIIMCGIVFNDIEPSSRVVPLSYHTLFTFPVFEEMKPSDPAVDWADHFRTCIKSGDLNMWHLEGILSLPDRDLNLNLCEQRATSQECQLGTLHLLSSLVCTNGNQESVELGQLYLVEKKGSNTHCFKFLCEVSLSKLVTLKFRIPSEKFLWSNDYHVKSELDLLIRIHDEEVGREVEVSFVNGHKPHIVPEENFIWPGDTAQNETKQSGEMVKEERNLAFKENCQGAKMLENAEKESNNEIVETCKYILFSRSNFDMLKEFRASSVYPLRWTHDLSFWENETIPFDVNLFHLVIKNIAGDEVVSAELIDSFRDPSSGRQSRCHRLVFNSIDKCLSYNCSWKLQSLIRLEVEKLMKITLR